MIKRFLPTSFLGMTVFMLYACVGSEGGIGGTGISTGSVTSFGSVYVNGVRFDTTGTSIVVNGNTFPNGDERVLLSEGMVVTVRGDINADGVTGTASQITYNQSLEGPIQGAPTASSFVVLGQTIFVDSLTQIRNGLTYPGSFADGDVVEVSGFIDANGNLRATFIEKTSNSVFSIRGIISAVDNVNNQFTLNSATNQLVVLWSNTAALAVNDFVEVEGNSINTDGELVATRVDVTSEGFGINDADDAELEGYVTATSCNAVPCSFSLNNQTVNVTASTIFEGGMLTDIQPGIRLEVEGSLSSGVLNAEKIEFKDSVEMQSNVVAKTTSSITLEFGNNDIQVMIDNTLTEVDGIADINSINIGDSVKVRGREITANTVFATRVEWQDVSTDLELQGAVTAFDSTAGTITILGVTVDTSAFADGDFKGNDNIVLGRTAFFAALAVGDLVSLNGTITGSNISWSEVEMED